VGTEASDAAKKQMRALYPTPPIRPPPSLAGGTRAFTPMAYSHADRSTVEVDRHLLRPRTGRVH
jgi:hypothetical protein